MELIMIVITSDVLLAARRLKWKPCYTFTRCCCCCCVGSFYLKVDAGAAVVAIIVTVFNGFSPIFKMNKLNWNKIKNIVISTPSHKLTHKRTINVFAYQRIDLPSVLEINDVMHRCTASLNNWPTNDTSTSISIEWCRCRPCVPVWFWPTKFKTFFLAVAAFDAA